MSFSKRSALVWYKLLTQTSTATGGPCTLTGSQRWGAKKILKVTLEVLLGLGGFWLINEALQPEVAEAYTARINLPINRQQNESYETLVRRAKAVALATTQQKFYQNVWVTNVSIVIVGQHQGAIAPVLSLQISRPQWHRHMAICSKNQSPTNCLANRQHRVRYFSDARSLLGFEDVTTTITNELGTANLAPTPNQSPENAAPTLPSQASEPDTEAGDRVLQSPEAIVPVEVPDTSQNQDNPLNDSPTISTPANTLQTP